MNEAPKHSQEKQRVEALRRLGLLGMGAEEFEGAARLAAEVCGAGMGAVTLLEEKEEVITGSFQWEGFKEKGKIARKESIGAWAILEGERLVIPDVGADERTRGLGWVKKAGWKFYAGVPLRVRSGKGAGLPVGVLCVMDVKGRELSEREAELLGMVARQVEEQIELRGRVAELEGRQNEAEAFYHSLVETIPQNIFRKDGKGRFTFANSRFCGAVKRPLEEIIGKTDFDLFPPELALKYQQDDQRVLKEGVTVRSVEEHEEQGGKRLWVQVIKSPLYDARGEVCGIQGIFWDETDRYNAEEALAHERDLLRAMLNYLPDSIYFKDRQSRFMAISRALATRLGLQSPEEAMGRTDLDFFDLAHAKETYEDEQTIMRTGQPLVGKAEREVWPHGERWVLSTKVPLRNRQGEIVGTFGISKDITDLKLAEKELATARDVALESARLKSEFLANMSHEIRTPLNAVIGMTGLLLDTPLQAEQREFAETIRHSAEALLTIINDILDFSKIEAGKMPIESIDFDLSEVVEGTAELLAEAAEAKGIELASYIREDVPTQLCGDPGRLRQVLTNLTGNAVKFTEKGEVVIEAEKERENERTVLLKFAVRDTGVGIPREAHGRLFSPFVQADGSTTRRFGGTGLGLAISKQLVELMHGEIDFESEPGKGSTFWFRVAFEKQAQQQPRPGVASTLEGVKVLVVDDNSTNRDIVHHQAVRWRMRNGSAESGARALELLAGAAEGGDPYQLVILDMQMPGMDGLALAREISARPELGSPKLIMLTSMGHLQAEKKWRECGISAYLIKPVREARLYDTIVSVLRGGAGARRATREASRAILPAAVQMRILVAEDNVVNQKVALRQLQKLGYSADAVANGIEALQALRTVPYDVVLMDCQMPELDGYEATRQIRATERSAEAARRVYVVAMTANALAGDREVCIEAGMDDYVSKPVKMDELQAALGRAAEKLELSAANRGVVDRAVLNSLRELQNPDGVDPVAEIAQIFFEDTPRTLEKLQAAFVEGNLADVERAAHTLKGSASILGGQRLAEGAMNVMEHCRRGEFPPAGLVEGLPREFERFRAELETELKQPGPAKQE